MLAFDVLIEAIDYSNEEDMSWWTYFESIQEAKKILKEVSKAKLDEYEVVQLADSLEQDCPLDIESLEIVQKQCVSLLKRQLK
jgi:hypothetical protein